jgi:hypothetical protein
MGRPWHRNADRGLRELQRRYQAGDLSVWEAYVRALRGLGQFEEAARLVRERMVASGEWAQWPGFGGLVPRADEWSGVVPSRTGPRGLSLWQTDNYDSASILSDMNFKLAAVFDDAAIAVPMIGIEEESPDGDIETLWFNDGPYVVDIDPSEADDVMRMIGGASPGQQAFIPLWRVHSVRPPPFGIPQAGYEFLTQGHEPRRRPRPEDVSYGPVVLVDGPAVSEDSSGIWTVESGGHLAHPMAAAAVAAML